MAELKENIPKDDLPLPPTRRKTKQQNTVVTHGNNGTDENQDCEPQSEPAANDISDFAMFEEFINSNEQDNVNAVILARTHTEAKATSTATTTAPATRDKPAMRPLQTTDS